MNTHTPQYRINLYRVAPSDSIDWRNTYMRQLDAVDTLEQAQASIEESRNYIDYYGYAPDNGESFASAMAAGHVVVIEHAEKVYSWYRLKDLCAGIWSDLVTGKFRLAKYPNFEDFLDEINDA
jgi:hypothetical protein